MVDSRSYISSYYRTKAAGLKGGELFRYPVRLFPRARRIVGRRPVGDSAPDNLGIDLSGAGEITALGRTSEPRKGVGLGGEFGSSGLEVGFPA